MPVKRNMAELSPSIGSGGVVRAGPSPMTGLAQSAAKRQRDMARQFGKQMAVLAEDEGIALAKAATISTDANGRPTLPPNATRNMGAIARRAYDGTIEQKFGHKLTNYVRAQYEAAYLENEYDYESFNSDVDTRLAGIYDSIPPEFHDVVDATVEGLGIQFGSRVGMNEKRTQEREDAGRYGVMVQDSIGQIKDFVLGGQDAGAEALLQDQLEMIDAIPAHVWTPRQREKARDELNFAFRMSRMRRDLRFDQMTPEQLAFVREKLASGEDYVDAEGNTHNLLEYFSFENGTRYDMAEMAAREVGVYVENANRRASAEGAEEKLRRRVDTVLNGTAEGSGQDMAAMDIALSKALGIRTPDGGSRPMTARDWMSMSQDDRNKAIPLIKKNGFLPESLATLFKMADRQKEAALFASLFPLMRDLERMPMLNGEGANHLGLMPEEMQAAYQLVSDMHGEGLPNQETIENAVMGVWNSEEIEWNDGLRKAAMVRDGYMRVGKEEEESFEIMRTEVITTVFDGVEAGTEEKAKAVRIFEQFYKQGHTFEESLDLTVNSFENRYAESGFMTVPRSEFAPELHYATPGAESIGQVLDRAGNWSTSFKLNFLESMVELPMRILPTMDGFMGLPEWAEADFGAERWNASPFELMADAHIRDGIIANMTEGQLAAFDIDPGLLIGGKDYKLSASGSQGDMPVYTVHLRDRGGQWRTVGELDIRDDWRNYTNFQVGMEEAQRMMYRRSADFLLSGGKEAEEAWGLIMQEAFKDGGFDPLEMDAIEKLLREQLKLKTRDPSYEPDLDPGNTDNLESARVLCEAKGGKYVFSENARGYVCMMPGDN